MTNKKEVFYDKLRKFVEISTDRSFIMTTEKYEMLLNETKQSQLLKKNNKSLSSKQYRRLNRYDVLKIGDTEKLIEAGNESLSSNIRYFCKTDELFDILEEAHTNVGHKRTRVMEAELKKQYCNVTRTIINLYLSLCEQCQLKKKIPKSGSVVKPILSDCMNSRCQVNLIDMQSAPDKDYKFIMNYQDHFTQFTILRPIKEKTADEVAYQLLDIFCLFGAPCILQSDNDREFSNKLIKNLIEMWPGIKLAHGKPRHSQSQGSVERSNQDVRDLLIAWMADNNTQNWSEGLRYIQSKKNSALHHALNKSPYEAMFGSAQRIGLADSSIPGDVYASIKTEEDLQELVLSSIKNNVQNNEKNIENDEQLTKLANLSVKVITDVLEESREMGNDGKIQQSANTNIDLGKAECLKLSAVCKNEPLEAHKLECHEYVPTICRETNKNEGFEAKYVTLKLCLRKNSIDFERECGKSGLQEQANKMVTLSNSKFPCVEIGSNVLVRVPEVDRGRVVTRNIMCVVMSITSSGLYQLGNKEGTFDRLYAPNEFTLSETNFINISDVPLTSSLTLPTASVLSSGSKQGFITCHCKRYCIDKKCKCRAKNIKCNSKCHSKSSCKNK